MAAACTANIPQDDGSGLSVTGGVGGTTGGSTVGGAGGSAGTGAGKGGVGGTTGGVGGTTGGVGGTTGGVGGTTGGVGGTTGGVGGTTGGVGGTTGGVGGAGGAGGMGGRGMGGSGKGGRGMGGAAGAPGGKGGTGGSAGGGSGGSSTGGTGGDPCSVTTMPSGGTKHASSNASGTAAGLAWTIWSNGSGGSITTYDSPAFSAAWNNSGDFLARIGLQWNNTKTYDGYGTIVAQYNSKKTGSGGGYSYIGVYGWSTNPCVEWYIVDDSYNKMPVNPGNTSNKGTAMIDGGSYTMYTRSTSGTGGSKCSGVSNWQQFYSIRQSARTCGQISITAHFDAWAKAGMTLGKMDQAQLLVEVGGGSGSIDFPVANITTTM